MAYKDPERNRDYAREYARRYYAKHRDKMLARAAAYREANPEVVKATQRRHYANNTEKRRECSRRHSEKSKTRRSENWARWYAAHRKRICSKQAAQRKVDPAKFALVAKASRERRSADWYHLQYEKHKGSMLHHCHMRRAREAAATVGDVKEIRAFFRSVHWAESVVCHWCGLPVPPGKRHVDHVVPLSKGGRHSVENLVASCARCNCTKGSRIDFPRGAASAA